MAMLNNQMVNGKRLAIRSSQQTTLPDPTGPACAERSELPPMISSNRLGEWTFDGDTMGHWFWIMTFWKTAATLCSNQNHVALPKNGEDCKVGPPR